MVARVSTGQSFCRLVQNTLAFTITSERQQGDRIWPLMAGGAGLFEMIASDARASKQARISHGLHEEEV
jgi:hypothetical protein